LAEYRDKFERVFALHRELVGRRKGHGISFDDLQSRLEWSRSTLRRAITFLRDGPLQAPLVHDTASGGYYYDGDALYELPGLWFTAEELSALLVLESAMAQQPLGLLSEALAPAGKRLQKLLERSRVGVPDWHFRVRLLRMAAVDRNAVQHRRRRAGLTAPVAHRLSRASRRQDGTARRFAAAPDLVSR